MSDEEDYPEIGDRRHGRTLVCVGDDKPDQWVDWLESLVSEYEELERIAEEHTVNLDTGSKRERIEGWQDYCEAMGISIDGEAWESSMISGHYVMGWAELGTIRSARKTGKEILKRLRRNLLEQIRSVRIKELQKIKDLDTLIERTRDDRKTLLNENDRLKADLESSQNRTEALQQALAESKLKDTSALISDCLRIACAVNKSERQIIRA
ncbi:MAG TPA: hypothetical protein EYQ50_09130, partial [Verrucomicrobiales bacterium]|nr:hypothetical protein [Verrucomicrobiales bacterium]